MRFLLVDDHCLFTTSLKIVLERFDTMEEVVILNEPDTLIHHLDSGLFSLLLLDIHLGAVNGLDVGRFVKIHYPDLPVVFLTGFDLTEYKYQAHKIGADGFFNKSISPKELFKALEQIANNQKKEKYIPMVRSPLSPREKQILILISQGLTHCDIANTLGLSKRTIESNLHSIYKKFNVTTISAALMEAVRLGIVRPQSIV